MSSPSLTGYSPNNPRKYLGPNVGVSTVVVRNRAPTGADIKQPNTGKYYPFGSFWLVGETSPGVEPITGARGDLWYLEYIDASVAVWLQLNTALEPIQDFQVQVAVSPGVNPVSATETGLINVNALPVTNIGIPIQSITRALNTYNIEAQYAGSSSTSTPALSGLSHFNNTQFSVDANGFVSSLLTQSEGNFTPVLTFGGASTGITYTSVIGNYTIVGNTLFYNIYMQLSSKGTATGLAAVSGLPFTSAVQTIDSFLNMTTANIPANTFQILGIFPVGGTTINLGYAITGTPITGGNIDNTSFTNTTALRLWGFYYLA